jgi:hypothetical protein
MNTYLSAIWKSLLVGSAVLVWIVLVPILDCLRSTSSRDSGPSGRPYEDVPAPARRLRPAA